MGPFMKRFYRTFGSLKLAVVTLASLTGILIFSTFYESRTSTREVQMLVYQSWWFIGLLFVLGLNVFCAAMSRYPWKGYQAGFVITHLGIITMLVGSIIGLIFGVEGSITMLENGPPRNFITQDFEVVQVQRAGDKQAVAVPIGTDKKPVQAGGVRPLRTKIPGLQLGLKARHANTKEELIVRPGGTESNPAVHFTFSSQLEGMEKSGMNVSEWLVLNDPDRRTISVGPAVFKIESLATEEAVKARLAPRPAGGPEKGIVTIKVDGQTLTIPVNEYLEKEFVSADGSLKVRLQKYFAELRMVDKAPVSASDEPNNPAVFFELNTPKGKYKGFVFADHPEVNMIHGENGLEQGIESVYTFDDRPKRQGMLNTITILVGPDERLYFTSDSARSGFNSGELKLNEGLLVSPQSPIKPVLTIQEFVSKPLLSTRIVPASTNRMTQFIFPAVELQIKQGGQTAEALVRWGEPKRVEIAGTTYDLTFGWSTVPINFSVQLEKFNMPQYEGTEMPAGYESHVKVKHSTKGDEFSQKIWMNHPLTYEGYRISQASFDPPGENGTFRSTLQVLKDPGWVFKWVGSIFIVGGIITMFYIKPYFKGLQKERARRAASESGKREPRNHLRPGGVPARAGG